MDASEERDNTVKIDKPESKSRFFGGVSAFAHSVGGSMKSAANAVGSAASSAASAVASTTVSAANAVGSATTSAASAVVEGAKSLVPEKKPETALVFYRGDFLIFEDRIEKHGRKYYFNALKNLTIEKRVRETSNVEVGSLLGRAAMGALNGAANGGLIGAVAGGVSGAIDGGDAKESKPKETRTEYLIGAPERPDRDETIYSTDDADDANETLREILAALAAAQASPALWKNGRKTDAENFRFD